MMKTSDELYEETVEDLVKRLVADHLENQIGYLDVVEFLEEEGGYDAEFIREDVYTRANAALDTILQRWLDD